jgi:uncharacterized Zn finger protein (UPF0148 family)
MTKYTIEGNIDFYSELYKSMDEDIEDVNDDNLCLITNLPLTDLFVKMECGHKFNYKPLFYDIQNHKKKFNNMERHTLRILEIRCPYCRKIQKNLLPYHEGIGIEKVHGVNFYDEKLYMSENKSNSKSKFVTGKCYYEYMNYKEPPHNVFLCSNTCVELVEEIGKTYCIIHKYTAQKNFIIKKKMEQKQKEKDEKLKIKLEAKLAKELAKENLKKQKLEMKGKNTKPINISISGENVIVSSTNSLFECSQILKTGVNKGNKCGCKVFKDNLCTRHYNLINKNHSKI